MKVIISVIRKTEYTSIVEMDEAKFNRIRDGLNASRRTDRATVRLAEKEANSLIDTKDWQDDDLDSVEQFEEYKEQHTT